MATNKQYQAITASIIRALENGTVPWQKAWKAPRPGHNPNAHHNAVTGRNYAGLNVITLWAEAAQHGYESAAWLTYNQAAQLGGNVKRGERSATVSFWKPLESESVDPVTREVTISKRWMLKMYGVFNVDQTEGVTLPTRRDTADDVEPEPFDVVQLAQGVVDGYINNGGPSLSYTGGNEAYYRPSKDEVRVPELAQYNSPGEAYSTIFHELGHSTGHESRLKRLEPGVKLAPFGSEDYSREELVAELTAAYLCAETGIDNTLANSAAYIASWLRVLQNDPKMVTQAAGKAQKAAAWVLDASASKEVTA